MLMVLLRVKPISVRMTTYQARVKGHVRNLAESTRRNGKSLSSGYVYTMMKMLMVHYAKNGHIQPLQQRVEEVFGLTSLHVNIWNRKPRKIAVQI